MYTEAPEVEEVANLMIDTLPEFEHLKDKPISYTFSDKAVMMWSEPVMGKVTKAPVAWKPDGLADFKVLISGESWDELDLTQRQALIHHLLMHCAYRQETKRNKSVITVPYVRMPSLQAFPATRKRFGDWTHVHDDYLNVESEPFEEAYAKAREAEQAELFTPDENDLEAKSDRDLNEGGEPSEDSE